MAQASRARITSVGVIVSLVAAVLAPSTAVAGRAGDRRATTAAPAASTVSLSETWEADLPTGTGQITFSAIEPIAGGVVALGGVGGVLDGATSLGGRDVFVARYDASGELSWATHVGSAGDDDPASITTTADSIYVSLVTQPFDDGWPTAHLVRLRPDGDVAWTKRYDHDPSFRTLAAGLPDGGVALATRPIRGDGEREDRPVELRRLRGDGTQVWLRSIGGCCGFMSSSWGYAEAVATDQGGIMVTGVRGAGAGGARTSFVHRYAFDGTLAWSSQIASTGGEITTTGVATNSSATWVVGVSGTPITSAPDAFPDPNPFVRRYAGDGAAVWTKPLAVGAVEPDCASFLVSGSIPYDIPTDRRIGAHLSRLTSDGSQRWRWELPGTLETRVDLEGVAAAGSRAYLLIDETTDSGTTRRLVAVDGLPNRTDCDTVSPTATKPGRALLKGKALTMGAIPTRISWTGADAGSRVARYELGQQTNGGAWTTVSTTLTKPLTDRALATERTYRFRVRAVDMAGNVGAWAYGDTFRLSRFSEGNSRITYSGTWSTSKSTVFWGGVAKASSRAGARASITFNGRSVAWVSSMGPTRGKADVLVDGLKVATVDLYSSTARHQQVVWAASWTTATARTITIRVQGTSGRPRVDLDAFVTAN